jgi:DNA polymerase III subunit chi
LTEISFHFNAPDKLAYACRLLRKAVNGGAQVVVTAAPETLAKLDTLLWTISPLDFIAHCFAQADSALVSASPVLLGMPMAKPQGQGTSFALESPQADVQSITSSNPASKPPVLVNLGDTVPEGFERFERLVEVVGASEEDRACARDRWKHYAHRGYAITRHDLAAKSGAPTPAHSAA